MKPDVAAPDQGSVRNATDDAKRYRWLREAPDNDLVLIQDYPAGYNGSMYMSLDLAWKAPKWEKYTPAHLDAAIDAAIRALPRN